jgi:hypothetical protein
MKRASLTVSVVCTISLIGLLFACKTTTIQPDDKITTRDVFEKIKSPDADRIASDAPNSFYVQLQAVPERMPKSKNECVDRGFWSWLRRLTGVQDAAEVTLTAEVSGPGIQNKLTLPLFILGMKESPKDSEQNCYSWVTDRELTPTALATKATKYDITLQVYHSKTKDFTAAEKLMELATELMQVTGGSTWLVSKFGEPAAKKLATDLDKSLREHWTISSKDTFATSLSVSVADTYDSLKMSAGKIKASGSGIQFGDDVPTMAIRLQYVDSLFAKKDIYARDPNAVLTTSLGKDAGKTDITIDRVLSGEGFYGVTQTNLEQISTLDQLNSHCGNLQRAFSANLSDRDALVARFSILSTKCKYYRVTPAARDERQCTCFKNAELRDLERLGPNYKLTEIARPEEDKARRDNEVGKIMETVLEALIRKKDAETISSVFTPDIKSHFLHVLPPVKLATTDPNQSWMAAGQGTLPLVCNLAQRVSRMGCYQATPTTSLTSICAVLLIGNESLGGAFTFGDNGKVEGITIAPISMIRKQFILPADWPGSSSKCPLVN